MIMSEEFKQLVRKKNGGLMEFSTTGENSVQKEIPKSGIDFQTTKLQLEKLMGGNAPKPATNGDEPNNLN